MEPRRPQGRRTGRSLRAGRPRWPQGWRGFPNTPPPCFTGRCCGSLRNRIDPGVESCDGVTSTRKNFPRPSRHRIRLSITLENVANRSAAGGEQVGRGYATPRAPRSTWQGKALRRPSRCIPSRPRLSPVMKLRFPNPSFMGVAPRQRARGRVLGAEGAPRAARRLGHSVTPPNATKERGGR